MMCGVTQPVEEMPAAASDDAVRVVARPVRPRWLRWLRRLVALGLLSVVLVVALVVGSVLYVDRGARGHVYDLAQVPDAPVVLVLGAQVLEPGDNPSPFLAARLELARQLYVAGRVKAILVSGDNRRHDYNEPGGMAAWLTARG